MMVGLPGTGKSSIVECVARLITPVVVSTDRVRTWLRPEPTYTAAEMMLVYEVSYSLIERRLKRGERVIFDASNYLSARREFVSQLATRCGAPVAVCYAQASQQVIRSRLQRRDSNNRRNGDLSDANWAVYKWMVEAQEPVAGPHLILDTTITPATVLAQRLYQYWTKVEASAARNPDLQSPSWVGKFGFYSGASG
jgi:predicted kinase